MSRQRSLFSTLAGFPVRLLRSLPRTLLALLVIAALALNAATLVSEPTFRTLSDIAEAVVGDRSVQARAERQQTELAARADAAEEDADALKVRIAELETEKARLTQELAETRVVYRGAERPAREAVAEASAAIGDRVSKAAARNVASMPGEALPFIGIAVDGRCRGRGDRGCLRTDGGNTGAEPGVQSCSTRLIALSSAAHRFRLGASCGAWSRPAPPQSGTLPGISMRPCPRYRSGGTYKWTLVLGQRIYYQPAAWTRTI